MSGGITVTEFKHISGVNDAEYIKRLEELHEIDKGIISKAVAKIKMLSTQPERKTGHWVFVHPLQKNDNGAYICSECKVGNWEINPKSYFFCPNCGTDMRGGEQNDRFD